MEEAETGSPNNTSSPEGETKTALALAVIVHDIRTPLGAVSATADLLAASELDPRQRSYVDTLQQAVAALNDLATELLDQAGDVPPEPVDTLVWSPAAVLHSLGALFAPLADEHHVRLEMDVDDELAGPAKGDPHAVRRILTNLMDNAVKFTGRFAENGTVHVKAGYRMDAGRHLVVTVADDGPGIAAGELPNLFLPYRQGASGQRLRSGSGLGLWISRTLAHRLGGQLEVTSELGHGTCFTLEVPCVPAEIDEEDEGADPVDISARPPPSSGEDRGIVRVLVVDDNSVNRLLITTFLDSFGMAFKAVGSGEAALASVEHDEFDVIVMDLQMPDMDGLEASLRLRETEKGADIPIVALTAGMKPADTVRCRRARFSAVLGKPFAPADLLKALTDAVARVREEG